MVTPPADGYRYGAGSGSVAPQTQVWSSPDSIATTPHSVQRSRREFICPLV